MELEARSWSLQCPRLHFLLPKVFHHDPSGDGFFLFSDSTPRPQIRVHACPCLRWRHTYTIVRVHMHTPFHLDRVLAIHIIFMLISTFCRNCGRPRCLGMGGGSGFALYVEKDCGAGWPSHRDQHRTARTSCVEEAILPRLSTRRLGRHSLTKQIPWQLHFAGAFLREQLYHRRFGARTLRCQVWSGASFRILLWAFVGAPYEVLGV